MKFTQSTDLSTEKVRRGLPEKLMKKIWPFARNVETDIYVYENICFTMCIFIFRGEKIRQIEEKELMRVLLTNHKQR